MICTAHEEAHKLRFVLEAVTMLYTLLRTARNSGEPSDTMFKIVNGKLGDVIAALPMPPDIFALSHVAATAAMAGIMTSQRHCHTA